MKIKDEAVAGIVAGAAFVASAEHIIHVVTTTGGSTYTGWTYPLGIDGLVYVGIMAARRGRRAAGLLAIAIGAAYSLAFNADALGAFQLPRIVIAASMPICMLAAFVIVHSGRHVAEEWTAEVIEAVKADVDAARYAQPLPDEDAVAMVVDVNGYHREPIESKPSRPSGTGRAPAWDVAEAVRLVREDVPDADVASKVGASTKSVQRLRRIVAHLASGLDDAAVVAAMGAGNASASLVARVREAVAQ